MLKQPQTTRKIPVKIPVKVPVKFPLKKFSQLLLKLLESMSLLPKAWADQVEADCTGRACQFLFNK